MDRNQHLVMTSPAVSVVVPVYNASKFLGRALDSVLSQTFSDFELIAVDDGSTDASKSILENYARRDARVRVISRPNTGIVGALNDGLAVAKGEFVARMDADDFCLPNRFEKQVAFLRSNPDHVAVGSYFIYIDAEDALLQWNPRETDADKLEKQLLTGDGGALIHPAVMFRREAIEQAGRYRVEAQWVEDLDLYLRLARLGKLSNLPEVLFHYRYHEQSVNFTRNEGRHQRKMWAMEQAYRARGLSFDASRWDRPTKNRKITASDARDFAITSLRFPGSKTAWRYAFRALRLDPKSRKSWQVAVYVAKATLGLVPRFGQGA